MAGKGDDKTGSALVTGASGGIGSELARVFAEEGYNLVLVARSRDKLRALAEELKAAHGTRVTVVPADLSDPAVPRAIFDQLREHGIPVDTLVNNAGSLFEGPFRDIALEEHLGLLQLNVVALTAMTRLFLEPMIEHGKGRILNVASTSAFMPIPNLATYAASKAFVLSLSESLSEELKGTGVTVTALCPGVTATEMVHGSSLEKMPGFMIMDAKTVARAGYTACVSGQAVHVAGAANEIATRWVQYQPRWLVRAVGGLLARQQGT